MEATGVWDELSQYSVARNKCMLTGQENNTNKISFVNNTNLQKNNGVIDHVSNIKNDGDSKKTSARAIMVKQNNKKTVLRKRQLARCKRIIIKNRLAFADICGGPGSFAEALLTMGKQHNLH